MNYFSLPVVRIFSLALGLTCFFGGLALKGFFAGGRYRRQRTTLLFSFLILVLIGFWMAGVKQENESLQQIQQFLLNRVLLTGRIVGLWIGFYVRSIRLVLLSSIIILAGVVGWTKKQAGLPFLLLIFSAGASLIGGMALGREEISLGVYFLAGACFYAWFCGLVSHKTDNFSLPDRLRGWTGYFLLTAIVLLGFFLRIYNLGNISFRFDHYETDYAQQALKVLSGYHNIYLWQSTIWRGLGHMNFSPIYTYCVALSFRIFGVSIFSLKLVAVIYGTIALLFTYGIFKTLFSRRLALLTTFLLAVSPMHINYSRIGLLLVSTQTVSLMIIYLLLRCLHKGKSYHYILLGGVISGAGYFYSPAKYPILICAVLFLLYIFFRRRFLRRNFTRILLLILTVLVLTVAFNIPTWGLISPSFAGYESVWHRTQAHQFTRQADYIRALPLIRQNFTRLIHSFFINRNFNYNPWPCGNLYFNPFIAIMTLTGIAYSLVNIKKVNYRLLLFFTAAFLIPNLLSRPPVVVRRMMVSWPFIYCLAAIPISQLFIKSRRLFRRSVSSIIIGLTIAALLGLGAYNCHVFFDSNQPAGRWDEERYFDEYAKKLLPDYHLYILPINQLSRKTIDFLLRSGEGAGGRGYEYISSRSLRQIQPDRFPPGRSVAFVVGYRGDRSELNRLRQKLGRGRIEQIKTRFGRVVGYALLIPPVRIFNKNQAPQPKADQAPPENPN